MKKIYNVCCYVSCEMEFFFNEKGELLDYWNLDDAIYCHEYMSGLFKKLGYKVIVDVKWTDERWKNTIKKILIKSGATEEDFKNE